MKNNISKFAFTEDLCYSQTAKQSIWGDGDTETLQFLNKLIQKKKLSGKWLHFASGDGRYNNILLSEVDSVIATDLDKGALDKLKNVTPKELLSKLKIREQDITKAFPFKDKNFDGVFNTGTIHLFPKNIIEKIIEETHRVLKLNGLLILDFATDVKRIKKDGTFVKSTEIEYSKLEAKNFLEKMLSDKGYKATFSLCTVPEEKVTSGNGTYMFSCNYWLILAKKFK